MDLRSVLNTSDNGDSGRPKPPPQGLSQQQQPHNHHHHQQQQHHHQHHPPSQSASQSPGPYGYRDYPPPPHAHQNQHPQASPGQPPPRDYPLASPQQQPQQPPNSYPPASPYQTPGQYGHRGAPPPLQTVGSFKDGRSPSVSSMAAPAQSPYRQPPTPSSQPSAPGYPFPPTQAGQEVASPGPRHQFPPGQQYQQQQQSRRESYSQGAPGQYMQQQPVPQTPPVGTPAGSHSYLAHREQSVHSSPTPTSAHSQQQQFGPPYAQGSPISASHSHNFPPEYNRQPSQPPTPSGRPSSAGPKQPAGQTAQGPPQSPYQQRSASGASTNAIHAQPSPRQTPLSLQRVSSIHSVTESLKSESRPRPQLNLERQNSISVSPKTRISSLPNQTDIQTPSAEPDPKAVPSHQIMTSEPERAVTPAKRKLQDSDVSPAETERKKTRPSPTEVNGDHKKEEAHDDSEVKKSVQGAQEAQEAQEQPPQKRRRRYTEPPIWAQNVRSLRDWTPKHPNFVLSERDHANGHKSTSETREVTSRRPSPVAVMPSVQGDSSLNSDPDSPQAFLGPWEGCLTGMKPIDDMHREAADYFIMNVISRPDQQEIIARGIQFEIEGKLGTLIDKDTNDRVNRQLLTESILVPSTRVAFKSSMSSAYHKAFNEYLNEMARLTHLPQAKTRVPIVYKHRREVDRFFEIPRSLQDRIPGCMQEVLSQSGRKNVKVRVTEDQETRKVLSKIIKARISDLDLHMPNCPLDCRISINLEMDWEGSVEELHQVAGPVARQPDRNKDRLSYTHGLYQMDLTQVTQNLSGPGGAPRVEKEHELEIELSATALLDQGNKALTGEKNKYLELVEGMIDNIRQLARKSKEFH